MFKTMFTLINPRCPLGFAALLLAGIGAAIVPAGAQLGTGLNTDLELEHDGETRVYDVYVPPGLDQGSPSPLVIDLHGLLSNSDEQRGWSGMDAVADTHFFIVAYPNSLGASWTTFPGQGTTIEADDVGFLRALIEAIDAQVAVDRQRVYATGLSNGGAMTQRLACDAADTFGAFVAFAPATAESGLNVCQPSRAVPILNLRGTTDQLIPFEGGLVEPPFVQGLPSFTVRSAEAELEWWRELNGCAGGSPDQVEDLGPTTQCSTYTDCADGVQVSLCAVQSTGPAMHVLYQNADGVDLAAHAWDFMSQFTAPTDAEDGPDIDRNINRAWNNPADSGEGILLDYGPSLDLLFGAWFTSTLEAVEPPGMPEGIGGPSQRWLTMLLEVNGDVATGTLQARQGGAFGSPETDVEINPTVGEITIELMACNLAQVDYTIDSAGISGSFDMEPLEKTVNPDGFTCTDETGE